MKLLGQIPKSVYLAFSGGSDSCAALSFLLAGRRDVTLLYYNHGTEFGAESEAFARAVSESFGIPLIVRNISTFRERSSESMEEYWRNARYSFFHQMTDKPIVMAHHLDDAVETYLFNCMHGRIKTIPYENGNVIRPFLACDKKDLMDLLYKRHGDTILGNWMNDPSNSDKKYMRNFIRLDLKRHAMVVNPGLSTIVRKIIMEEFSQQA